MTLRDFIQELDSVKNELKDQEIKIVAPNGLLLSPRLTYQLKDQSDPLNLSQENVDQIVISF